MSKLLFFFIALYSSITLAEERDQDTVTLFGTSIPGMFDDVEIGPYNIIYNRIIAGVRADVVMTMLPIRRATKVFSARGVDCMFLGAPNPSFYVDHGMREEDIIYSDTIKTVFLKIYGPIGSEPYEDASILHAENFAVDVGVGEIKNLVHLIPIQREGALFASTLVDGFRLLDQGRVSALVAIDIDVKTLQAKDARYDKYSVSDSYVLRQTKDVFVCRKFPRTERFIEDVNRRTKELRQAGLLEDVFIK